MSGIRVGTHLEQLYALRDRVALEIRAEERRLALARPSAPPGFDVFIRPGKNRVDVTLEALGVTSGEVRQWAIDAGLIAEKKRGRIAAWLVDAYAEAHPPTTINRRGQP